MWIHSSYEIIVRQYQFIYEIYEFIDTMNSYIYEFIVAEYEFIYACIWIHIHYEFIYLWIHMINYEFIVDTMNSYLPIIQMATVTPWPPWPLWPCPAGRAATVTRAARRPSTKWQVNCCDPALRVARPLASVQIRRRAHRDRWVSKVGHLEPWYPMISYMI
jgi:hypothetical protein